VEVTHNGKNAGVWAAGATLVGQANKDTLSYFVFEGNEGIFPLFFQKQSLKRVEKNGIVVYGTPSHTLIQTVETYEVEAPRTFIITNNVPPFSSENLWIGRSPATMAKALSEQEMVKKYPFQKKEEKWLHSFIAAYVLGDKAEGKARALIAELENKLTTKQLAAFKEALKKEQGHEFSAAFMDEVLSRITDRKTPYFENNKVKKRKLISLYFVNNAKWIDKDGERSVESITMNNTRYYLLTDITENLGFTYEKLSTHLYLTNGATSFRLYPGKTTFLYNEKAYSIKGDLLMEFRNQFYISEKYVRKVFSIFVREKDNQLELVSLL
jgi:hypothetical protein